MAFGTLHQTRDLLANRILSLGPVIGGSSFKANLILRPLGMKVAGSEWSSGGAGHTGTEMGW